MDFLKWDSVSYLSRAGTLATGKVSRVCLWKEKQLGVPAWTLGCTLQRIGTTAFSSPQEQRCFQWTPYGKKTCSALDGGFWRHRSGGNRASLTDKAKRWKRGVMETEVKQKQIIFSSKKEDYYFPSWHIGGSFHDNLCQNEFSLH